MAKEAATKPTTKKSTLSEVVTREYTIHLHKHVFGRTFKKRAPHAIKVIRKFAQDAMKTSDVRLDPSLNTEIWKRGVKSLPHRIRVRLSRKKNDSEDAKERLFTMVEAVPIAKSADFKGLQTETIHDE
ncbi:60S ribosomal protein L31 [Podochytrium sp. JEL0797]|nr:60S ribosomal protein L31 [Podochytrium sp. JEL0797]